MSFDEILKETNKLKDSKNSVPLYIFTFFKYGRPLETVWADTDGEAVSKMRELGYSLEYFDKYLRFDRNRKVYALFKTI